MRQFNWLRAYAEYTSESESPDSWHLWTGLSVIASAARRNVWLNQGIFMLYPNMYVVLTGPAGLGKSTSIRMGRRLLLGLEDVIFGPDSVTREELIRLMAKSGGEGKQSAMTLHSTEMSSIVESSGIHMVQFLTDIYDGDFKWKHATKHHGRDAIHNPILNILCGTYPEYLAEEFPVNIVKSGFGARTIFAYEEEARFPNPFPKEPPEELIKALIEDLGQIALLEGPFEWDPEAHQFYDDMYRAAFGTKADDYRLDSFHNRKIKVHVLKVAMLLSMAERDDKVIYPQDLETAKALLDDLESTMLKTFSAVGKYEYSTDLERIIAQVYTRGEMSAMEIYDKNRSVGDADTIGKILVLAEKTGSIVRERRDGTIYFKPAGT